MRRKIMTASIFASIILACFPACSKKQASAGAENTAGDDSEQKANAQTPFIITVDLSGISEAEGAVFGETEKNRADAGSDPAVAYADSGEFTMPIRIHKTDGAIVRYDLDCDDDGVYEFTGLTGNHACRYKTPGPHRIAMRGDIPGLYLGDELPAETDCGSSESDGCRDDETLRAAEDSAGRIDGQQPFDKRSPRYMGDALLSVDQWGSVSWKTMQRMFKGCTRMTVKAADVPRLGDAADMSEMFAYASAFNQPLEKWNVSAVKNMSGMFLFAWNFNQPLESWNVSAVVNMSRMFNGAYAFDQPLEKWDVSAVTDMSGMFSGAGTFNRPLEKWNVSNVVNMRNMFANALSFDQPLEKWDVSSVTDMSGMFWGAHAFNRPLEKWNVSGVVNMREMFRFADAFDRPLAAWDVSAVTDMSGMFKDTKSFNRPLETWNVSNAADMSGMFKRAKAFNHPLGKWNVSNEADVRGMFTHAGAFDRPVETWGRSRYKELKYECTYEDCVPGSRKDFCDPEDCLRYKDRQ